MGTEVYFTRPGNKCEISERIRTDISHARRRILVASYAYTDPSIKEAVNLSPSPIKRFVLNVPNPELDSLDKVYLGTITNDYKILMHHKFLIADNILWLGSFNFSIQASSYNWENTLRITDPETVNEYIKEFESMYVFGKAFTEDPTLITLKPFDENRLSTCRYCKDANAGAKELCFAHKYLECSNCKEKLDDPFDHYYLKITGTRKVDCYYEWCEDERHTESLRPNPEVDWRYEALCKDIACLDKTTCSGCGEYYFKRDLHLLLKQDSQFYYEKESEEYNVNDVGDIYSVRIYSKTSDHHKLVTQSEHQFCTKCLYKKMEPVWLGAANGFE